MYKLIGQGKTAKVFSDNHFAYKVYNKDFNPKYIKYEVDIQNEIYNNTHINVCKYDYNNKEDFVKMTLITGSSLADRIRKEKYKGWLEDLVDLQTSIYQYKNIAIPNAFTTYQKQIEKSKLDNALKINAINSLESIENIQVLCHLDFHPENILFDGHQYYIIDWMNAKLANPIMDIARTYIILKQYIKRQANKYLRMIAIKMNINEENIKKALPLMAFLRLEENDDLSFNKILIDMIQSIE